VYDELKYTVTAKNKEEETRWEDITIRNKLPEGLTLIEDSIKLIDPEGKEIELKVEDVYNEKTRTIEVPIELIEGGKNYQLVYNVYVNGKSMKEQDIHNTIEVEGKNPDKSPTKTESETVLPEGGEKVELADPEPEIKVEVENKTRPTEEEAKVGDELEYQIEVKNTKKDSKWEGAIVEEKIPEGIEIISEYIEIEYPDGHREKIKVEEVYDKESRTLRIELGDIYGEEVYRIIYKARVEKEGIEIIDRPVKRPEKEENEVDILGEDVKDKVKTEDEARVNVWLYMMGASMSLYITMILKGYKRRLEEQ
jgi:fimbrial isopeptide formation D2 family protein